VCVELFLISSEYVHYCNTEYVRCVVQ